MRIFILGFGLWPLMATAGEVPAWDVSDFGHDEELAGTNGWQNGYGEDNWGSWDGYAYPFTDHRPEGGSASYGSGTAMDNWLIRGDAVNDGATHVRFYNEDDDTAGVVFKHSSSKEFYLVAHYQDDAPYPLQESTGTTIAVVRVDFGQGKVLADVQGEKFAFRDDLADLRVEYNDGDIRVLWNDEAVIEVTDPDPLPAGKSGLYAYNNGYWDNRGDTALYELISVSFWDEDDDGVPDDTDNCEYDGNADQADDDEDGVGNACDDDYDDGSNNGDDDGSGNDDGSGDDDGSDPSGEGVTGTRACGCSSGASGAAMWWLFLPGALLWMRHRKK